MASADRTPMAAHSMLPHHRPHAPRYDAIICAGTEQTCRDNVPRGWQMRIYGQIGWVLPPSGYRPGDPD
ncbi:hypothetical protein [Planosporangium mesophilum]|uniref:hypothetical protein n=1 Tax=Planosporangium mesophilum TaxID=689768 RepID=UPI00143B1AFE|nr:hypothetical protein [Planosporangium mesophilum]NJC81711.1 hypothetical protein [Planosporangium mesophilum]